MQRKKFINLIFSIVIIMICLVGCATNKSRTLDNNVTEVYPDIEGNSISDLFANTRMATNNESYIKSNNTTIAKVKEALAMNKDVIPFEGEVGGTPYIVMESIQLVGDQWLYCNAEDGHVSADLLIKFVIDKDEIQFKTCAMDFNGEGAEILE